MGVSIPEYCDKMKAGQREIFYLSAPSRQLAENSPYYENLKKAETEVLFCYEPYDELVLMQLQQFDKKTVTSVEKEMTAARHFIKTQGANFSEEQRFTILQPQFEMNPAHPIIKKLNHLRDSNPGLAILVTEQLFANAMVSAGLVEDPRTMLKSMNSLLEQALEKH